MASQELYEKGETECLVWWKGCGREAATWEPEQHLVDCEECIPDFNQHHTEKQKEGTLTRAKRTSPNSGQKQISRSTTSSFSKAVPKALVVGKECKAKSSPLFTTSQKFQKSSAQGLAPYKNMDLARSGNRILVPKSPIKTGTVLDSFQDESPENPDPTEQGPEDTAAQRQWPRTGPGYTRCCHGRNGMSQLVDTLTANCMSPLQTSVMGVKAGKRKFIKDRRDQTFDKQLRFSQDGFTHILLSTKSSENNSLNPEVMKELQSALSMANADDSKLVLLSAVGSVFCCGLDFLYFIRRLPDDRKRESARMVKAIRNFVNTFIQFKKPIVIAVNGPAIEQGASILPLCDVVWANEKAWFQTPYTTFGQSPDGCSTVMFPKIMGEASANEMLLRGRKLMAQEACSKGLVSQVFWPGTFTQEVMVRIKELASCNPVVLEESKALMRCNMRLELEQVNERECEVLKKIWGSAQGMDSLSKYLKSKIDEF
ncbi:hypothetical protein FD755_019272 [Muntiacus reevesi]|uniref:Chromo domain-containing protein n=1 Tax=Muntiacus reevesi TaxID=9886 RepID=A0A5N3XA56_MUNRE|nr:hypothetical protein FD755_019272 [Muntiacus reevesi]